MLWIWIYDRTFYIGQSGAVSDDISLLSSLLHFEVCDVTVCVFACIDKIMCLFVCLRVEQ